MQAAVHWQYHDGFTAEFPNVDLVRNVFVAHQAVVTSSGGAAAADLILHLIEQEHGYDLSVAVADQMVYNAVRGRTALQQASLQSRTGIRSPHLIRSIEIMRKNLHTVLPPSEIACTLGISTRQLERLFERHLDSSPKKYFMGMRLERARHLLLQTETGVTEIALACGFSNIGHFSRVYRAAFCVSPSRQRARMPDTLSQPQPSY